MDLLLAEINRKKKEKEELKNKISYDGHSKFIKQADLIKAQELERTENFRKYEEERATKKLKTDTENISASIELNEEVNTVINSQSLDDLTDITKNENYNIKEIHEKLREYNEPIKLFGESEKDLIKRYENVVKSKAFSISNQIRSPSKELKNPIPDESKSITENKLQVNNDSDNESITKNNVTYPTDPYGNILFSQINPPLTNEKLVYKYFKTLLKRWENDLNSRDNYEKSSAKGKVEAQTHKQCKDHIKPLLRMCKRNQLDNDCLDIILHLVEMIKLSELGNFKGAHDEYIRTAIGNAAWPIGLTMVGIHERSGRERISTSKVAHVMNNEQQRKYLTSVKRLLTYAQTKRPDIPPSMKVL